MEKKNFNSDPSLFNFVKLGIIWSTSVFHWQFPSPIFSRYLWSLEYVASGSMGRVQRKQYKVLFISTFLAFFLSCCFSSKNLFLSFSIFFWWTIKFSQQNINQSETRTGDKKLSVELFLNCVHIKARPSPSKRFFICFNDGPSKMMENTFYFILKALFVLKIFKCLSWLFGNVEKTTWLER